MRSALQQPCIPGRHACLCNTQPSALGMCCGRSLPGDVAYIYHVTSITLGTSGRDLPARAWLLHAHTHRQNTTAGVRRLSNSILTGILLIRTCVQGETPCGTLSKVLWDRIGNGKITATSSCYFAFPHLHILRAGKDRQGRDRDKHGMLAARA